ncbi:MAG: hypothetical protein ACQER9_02075 [Nanobdellota archaeon]
MLGNTKKGQVISVDVAISLGVFMIILAVFFWGWNEAYMNKENYEINYELMGLTERISEKLLSSGGFPENWHELDITDFTESNVSDIGLIDYGGFVSYNKISALESLNDSSYEDMKDMLGLSGNDYEFELKVWIYDEGFSGNADFEIGFFDDKASISSKSERFFVFSNKTKKEGKLSLRVFKQ